VSVPVIDLGDLSDPASEPGEYPAFRHRKFDRAVLRRAAPAVLAGLCALLLGGSALPAPPLVREVWSVPFTDNDVMSVEKDSIYVNRAVAGGSELTAYDLATGAVRWARAVGDRPAWPELRPGTGVLMLPGDEQWVDPVPGEDGVSPYSYGGTVTVLDPATGETLWRQPGLPAYGGAGATVLLYERRPDGVITTLRMVNVRDGSVVWERPPPAGIDNVQVQAGDGDTARVVTHGPDGDVTVLRHSDGSEVISARLPWRPLSPATGAGSSITTTPGLVVIMDSVEGRGEMIAYRADTLEPLWKRGFTDWGDVQDCGPVICLAAGDAFTAIDPETGAERWTAVGNPSSWLALPEGMLLLSGGDDGPTQRIVDAATGRPVGPTGRGDPLHRDDRDGLIFLRDVFPDMNKLVVGRLGLTDGRFVTLGAIAIADERVCAGAGRHIACQQGGSLRITAVG
jgi:outer membrane protein assembly factor BamB